MTLIPWRLGKSLVWDTTCVDTLAALHIQATSSMVGAAATSAEQAKRRKYEKLDSSFIFVPFGVETLGRGVRRHEIFLKKISERVIAPVILERTVTLTNELVWPSKGAMLPS
ncbi:jg20584 [Pararge aegeria aegeria]|uniref:Jg20584 protein n=1 Tax=Pararge aegeria aegeria TaxID=348720 RepID=A0A8S4RPJ1_9NEOP|nr:jg20584 [Pararge aegeria aegeria]